MIPFNMATLMTGTLALYKTVHRAAADMPAPPGLGAAVCAVLAVHSGANLLLLRAAPGNDPISGSVRLRLILCLTVACTGLVFAFWLE